MTPRDVSHIETVADGVNDILGAVSEGLHLCAECHHFFDPKTRQLSKKYLGVYVVRAGGDKICGPCAGEPDAWPGR